MCGIFCVFGRNTSATSLQTTYDACKDHLRRRGPDYHCTNTVRCRETTLLFSASVLWLQGREVVKQPIENETAAFVYNGNLYNVKEDDSHALLRTLQDSATLTSICRRLGEVEGPFAFIYLDKRASKLYFCRDPFGRRSLLIGSNKREVLLTSVASKKVGFKCVEVPAIGLFCFDLEREEVHLSCWKFKHKNFTEKLNELERLLGTITVLGCETPLLYSLNCEPDLNIFIGINPDSIYETLLEDEPWRGNVDQLEGLLRRAVEKRVMTQPKVCTDCKIVCVHTHTGVLFSGGVDCSIIALLADQFVEADKSIDLLNVAFDKNAPDRITGIETLKELRELRPGRSWNFVQINTTEEELNVRRAERIAHLIYPRNSILDDSLGCALWFASRGEGSQYRSPCRVLLVGMGADELFGGYTKHRAALKSGWPALESSLEEDWQNLPHRNLARDDRVVSDHGRQLCIPYLDEPVVNFARNLKCWERTCPIPELPQGTGEKILLRCLAYKLGLKNAATFKKRALQFGSRIANRKENANDVSPRL